MSWLDDHNPWTSIKEVAGGVWNRDAGQIKQGLDRGDIITPQGQKDRVNKNPLGYAGGAVGAIYGGPKGAAAGYTIGSVANGAIGADLSNGPGNHGTGYTGGGGGPNDPYAQKAAGYDAIAAEIERLKGERKAQKDYAYGLADSKYEPTRKAINALYGDPSSWSL